MLVWGRSRCSLWAGVDGVSVRGCLRPRRGGRVPLALQSPKPRAEAARASTIAAAAVAAGRGRWRRAAPRPGASSPATGPTPPRWAWSWSACCCALGLWTDLAGPVGTALADGTGAVLGRARVAIPVACFAFAVVLLWPRRALPPPSADDAGDGGEPEDPGEPPTVRIAIGALLLLSPTSASCTSPTAARRSTAPSTSCATPGARSARSSRRRWPPPRAWSAPA